MLDAEAIAKLKLDMTHSMQGLGFAKTTIVLAALEAAISEHSDVSSIMVRRQELQRMHAEIQVLEGTLAKRDSEIAELRAKLGIDTPKVKPAPTEKVRAKKKPSQSSGGD
jgi:hypothetical protein